MDPQIILVIFLLLVVGAIAGVASGLFGIGGGIVLVPTFATLLPHVGTGPEFLMHMAVGTSLALILPAGSMATRKQSQLGNLEWPLFWRWLPWILAGVAIGSILLNYLSSEKLKIFFVFYLLAVTLYVAFQPKPPPGTVGRPNLISQIVAAPIIGACSVLLGIGGGTFTVPFFKFFHYPLKKAIAISTATSLFVGLGGGLGVILDGVGQTGRPDYSLGFIYIPAFLLITPAMMVFAPLGAKLAHTLPNKTLHRVYVSFLAVMTVYMFVKVFVGF